LPHAGVAQAEKADSSKPTQIAFDQLDADDVKQIKTFTGNVVLTRGTLLMKSPKAVVTEDPEGYQYVVLHSAPGTQATFRQKLDGAGDQWVEGQADRIEYDNKTELVKLFAKAQISAWKAEDRQPGRWRIHFLRQPQGSVRREEHADRREQAGRRPQHDGDPAVEQAGAAAGAGHADQPASAGEIRWKHPAVAP
jgi:lipopolysaccharide export system protein LptA